MKLRFSNCARIERELVAYVDGELGGWRSAKVKRHLDACAGCRRELRELQQVCRLVADLSSLVPDPLSQQKILRRARGSLLQRRRRWKAVGWRVPALTAAAVASLVIWQVGSGTAPRPVEVEQQGPAQAGRVAQRHKERIGEPGKGVLSAESAPAALARGASSSPGGGSDALGRRGRKTQSSALMIAGKKDAPSDLTDNPGLFLELEVLRDLEKLENFEAILQASSGQGREYQEETNAGQG